MKVICPNCGDDVPVQRRPSGTTDIRGVNVSGKVDVGGGRVSFGAGGKVSFGPGGRISFGGPKKATTGCPTCGSAVDYSAEDIVD